MTGLSVNHLSKSYGALTVLHDIDFQISEGEFLVLLGESGCGKSTLLRLISGLEEDHDGSILIGNKEVTHLDPKDRDVAMVFQSYALYPHMSVYDNIAFGMRVRKMSKVEIEDEVQRVARVLKLTEYLKRKPMQLSGGQRQRVAIGRAMVRDPKLFLFDEPLSNLDAKLRGEMRTEIKRLHAHLGVTVAYVTHDQTEAMTMADKIMLMNKGRIEQIGTPEQLYAEPDSLFTAQFIGSPEINQLPVTLDVSDGGLTARVGGIILPLPARACRGTVTSEKKATLAIRPEALTLGSGAGILLPDLTLDLIEPMGPETQLVFKLDDHDVRVRAPGLVRMDVGDVATISCDLSGVNLFDPRTGRHL